MAAIQGQLGDAANRHSYFQLAPSSDGAMDVSIHPRLGVRAHTDFLRRSDPEPLSACLAQVPPFSCR